MRSTAPSYDINSIINDYGAFLEMPRPGYIQDASALPHPKQHIFMALLVGIRTVKDVEIVKMLHSGIVMLSHYQDGVGDAIELPGVGMGDVTKLSPDELKSVMAGYDFEKWTHFSELMQAEQARNEGLVKEAKEANPLFGRSDQSPSWFASIAIAARRIFSGARI